MCLQRFSDKTVVAALSNGEVDKEGVRYVILEVIQIVFLTSGFNDKLLREQVASNNFAKPGGRYSATGQTQCIHYLLDQYSKVYAIVTAPNYPARVAFLALEELKDDFQEKFGTRSATQGEESLSKLSQTMLRGIMDKYEYLVFNQNIMCGADFVLSSLFVVLCVLFWCIGAGTRIQAVSTSSPRCSRSSTW
jgi:hypothetical protein